MNPASSEAARRQIVEFEELVTRFQRINEQQRRDSSTKPLCATSSLDTGLTSYEDAANVPTLASTLSLDRPQPASSASSTDFSILESLARWSRNNGLLNYLGGGQRPEEPATPAPPPEPLVEQV